MGLAIIMVRHKSTIAGVVVVAHLVLRMNISLQFSFFRVDRMSNYRL